MIICSNILTSISRQVSYCTRVLFRIGLLDCCPIDSCMKRETKVNSKFLLLESTKNPFIFLSKYYLIIWAMKQPNNFERVAILKI